VTDFFLVALTVALIVWGYRRGVSVGVLVAVAFGLGALIGSRLAPQILSGGLHDPLAPAIALPAALLVGGLLAGAAERVGFEARRHLRRRYTLDSVLGGILGAFLGIVLAWVIGVAAAQSDALKDNVRASEVITQLNTALPPPGPLVNPDRTYNIPLAQGPDGRKSTPGDRIKHAPAVENAAQSVVKVDVDGCGGRAFGSGWVVANGFVVTNAHVVHNAQRFGVRLGGGGKFRPATPVLYDEAQDVAVLRVPSVKGLPSLPIGANAKPKQLAAVLGFPFGRRYKARVARMSVTKVRPLLGVRHGTIVRRRVTYLRSDIGPGPGSSGGPIVDREGRVVAMTSAQDPRRRGRNQFAIPSSSVEPGVERALESPRRVNTGNCEDLR
jgi:S1-C subfamily serine protease